MKSSRNIGLDILRVAATAMVLICHSGFFSVGFSYAFVSFSGVLGVELFFLLSGLLVGKKLILAVVGKEPKKDLGNFFVNRFFRTVPLYYFALFLVMLLTGKRVPVSCLLFVQNYFEEALWYLPPAWSLTIEMWFYFLIPLLFWGLVKIFWRKCGEKKAVFLAIGVLYCIPLILRIASVAIWNPEWDAGVRKQIHLRMDSILTGVFLAAMKLYASDVYHKLAKHPGTFWLSAAGIAGLYVFYSRYLSVDQIFDQAPFWKIFLFTILPALCGLLVISMENCDLFEKIRGTWIVKSLFGLSTLGYGIYLFHWYCFETVGVYFEGTSFSMNWLGFLLANLLTVGIAAAAYWLVERPFDLLKKRFAVRLKMTQ